MIIDLSWSRKLLAQKYEDILFNAKLKGNRVKCKNVVLFILFLAIILNGEGVHAYSRYSDNTLLNQLEKMDTDKGYSLIFSTCECIKQFSYTEFVAIKKYVFAILYKWR